MIRWLLILVLVGSCVGKPQDSLMNRSIAQVLLANCIDSKFEVIGGDDDHTVVACDGSWRPWQSGSTDYPVAATLRSFGLTTVPTANGPQSSTWHSGFDHQVERENGDRSLVQGKIYGLTGKDRTFVILHRR
jgi:hypothetical protein